jgi:hypothetical protein
MDDAKLDRLVRAFAMPRNRRSLVALVGAAMAMLSQRVARGYQLGPATCGEEGAVCTLIAGCCDGFTCATSAINTSYGICVPGEGGLVSTGTTLISPFGETAVDEVSALMETASTAPTTDPQAEQEARIAATRARRDAKSTKQRTRLDTKRSAQRLRKDERKADRTARRSLRPRLKVELLFKQVGSVRTEVVKATNRDDVDVVLTRIETLQDGLGEADLTTSQFTLVPGKSYSLVSGLIPADAGDSEYRWSDTVVCDGVVTGDGYRLTAAFSRDEKNYGFIVRCGRARSAGAEETPSTTSRSKRNNHQHTEKKR